MIWGIIDLASLQETMRILNTSQDLIVRSCISDTKMLPDKIFCTEIIKMKSLP